MTPRQVRIALQKTGLTQARFAQLLDVTPQTIEGWLRRGVRSGPSALLLRLIMQQGLDQETIRSARKKKPR